MLGLDNMKEDDKLPRALLSFIGTNKYRECVYEFDGKKASASRFILHALTELFCTNWTNDDRIIVFLTQKAREMYWESNENEPKDLQIELCHILDRTGPIVIPVDIPTGKSIGEIWEIMKIIAKTISEDDHIIFDITHALRSIPLIGLVAIDYSRILKKARVFRILYGAFEILGPVFKIDKIPIQERIAPIFDLSPIVFLSNFTNAISSFIFTGNAMMMQKTVTELEGAYAQSIYSDKSSSTEEIKLRNELKDLKWFLKELNRFSEDIATCRSKKLNTFSYRLQEGAEKIHGSGPIREMVIPLIDSVIEQTSIFVTGSDFNTIQAAQWCIDHGLTQQAYTLLQEGIITGLLPLIQGSALSEAENTREPLSAALGSSWKSNFDSMDIDDSLKKFVLTLDQSFLDSFVKLQKYRNDINHGGTGPKPEKSGELREYLKLIFPILRDNIFKRRNE
jgi:CRISPR-associated Csx2 family protein